MLGKLTGEEEPDSSLDLPGGDGGPLVVVGKTAGLSSDPLEDVIDERVHDAHGLGGDTGVGVHLLEDLVDVDSIGLLALPVLLLVSLGDVLLGLAGLLGSLSRGLGGHGDGSGFKMKLIRRLTFSSLLYQTDRLNADSTPSSIIPNNFLARQKV